MSFLTNDSFTIPEYSNKALAATSLKWQAIGLLHLSKRRHQAILESGKDSGFAA